MIIPLRFLDWSKVKKTGRGYTKRELTVVRLLKSLSEKQKIKRFLNIGFHDYHDIRNRWWIDICEVNNIDWHILEIFEPNVKKFKQQTPSKYHHRIHTGNIKDIDTIFQDQFSVILHWHGPEHLKRQDFLNCLPALKKLTEGLLILGCPNGSEEQEEAYGNPYERHISFWTTEDFHSLGMSTVCVADKKPGHITAYRFI